jgi:hypothetical protein
MHLKGSIKICEEPRFFKPRMGANGREWPSKHWKFRNPSRSRAWMSPGYGVTASLLFQYTANGIEPPQDVDYTSSRFPEKPS